MVDRLGMLRLPTDSFMGRKARASDSFPSRGLNDKALIEVGVRLVPRLVAGRGRVAQFGDGQQQAIGAVVWATGYREDTSWVHIPGAVDATGAFVGPKGISPVAGRYFVGRSWQTSRGSALLHGVGRDAAGIANDVVARLQAQ